jgi:hypothetical protein
VVWVVKSRRRERKKKECWGTMQTYLTLCRPILKALGEVLHALDTGWAGRRLQTEFAWAAGL